MSKPFKLSAVLYGHSLDVRSICVTPNNSIVSGSRDKSAKLWVPNSINTGYSETITYRDQKNFVASVLQLDANGEFPTGVVITGGNDNLILVYKSHEPFATLTFKEHTNTVCHLSKGLEPNTFLSASWDGTAKLWSLNNPQGSLITFSGHTATVWSAIQLLNGNVVTASADKTVGIFSRDGFRIKTLQGHTDCVRDVIEFPELNCFMSVANDATIRMWQYDGSTNATYYGHTNYIYCIARNKYGGENCFVTSDEDRTVRYWRDGVNTENIFLPAQSVWCVACLSNGDIVTGTSDGVLRIFTQDESRFASEEMLAKYEEEVNSLAKQSTQEIGGIKVTDLPGQEALLEPGKQAGQMKMVRELGGVVAYTWVVEGENSHWEKVGSVLGGVDPKAGDKTTYEGKSYDFVFSVDVEDGKPPLKLPYNKGEDPYVAAHKFIEKHMLPLEYLDQVVNFITTNSKQNEEPNLPAASNYVDPFTGSSRYMPSSGAGAGGAGNSFGANLDPFTGASSYSTGTLATPASTSGGASNFYPQIVYQGYDTGNPSVILNKLKEFNGKTTNGKVTEQLLEGIVKLCTEPSPDTNLFSVLLNDMMCWNEDLLFPVLDVIRMALRIEENHNTIALLISESLLDKFKFFVSQDCKTTNNTLVTLRALCNLCLFPVGEQLVFEHRVSLLENITSLTIGNKNVQISLATLVLNITVMCEKHHDEFGLQLLASVIPDIIIHSNDPEAQFRGLVALGTLLTSKYKVALKSIIQENLSFVQKLRLLREEQTNDLDAKRNKCATQVLLELSTK